jgi:hypothetical protein
MGFLPLLAGASLGGYSQFLYLAGFSAASKLLRKSVPKKKSKELGPAGPDFGY